MRWTEIEDIIEALEEGYPNEDIMRIRFTQLHKYVTNLPEFNDDPQKSNEKILEAIQGAWIELRQENS